METKRRRFHFILSALAFLGIMVAVFVLWKGDSVKDMIDLGVNAVTARAARYTVDERIAEIRAKEPELQAVADAIGGRLRILVFKNERRVEVQAPGWATPRIYPMTKFSGTLGPKLKEGDRQIPEGVYGIEYLNPNSSYHLSMKVSYPNAFDRAHAQTDGRTSLGGDIMIHGKDVTVGCVPIGDDAIEELFYFVHSVGIKNVAVVIAPYDMRKGRRPELEQSSLPWYGPLCDEIAREIKP